MKIMFSATDESVQVEVATAKKHPCKHSIFVGCKLDVLTYPPDALAQPLGQKPKRGRPKKAQTQSQSRY
jgi:hypothetical protein